MELVDGYTHCGRSKYQPIESVKAVMQAAGVNRAVLVQHLGEFDNSYIGQIVADDPEHFAGVCIVNHAAPDTGETLRQLAESGHFKGIRITTDMAETSPQLLAEAEEIGLIILIYAPHGMADFVDPLLEFLEMHPEAQIVLTHMGNPDPANDPKLEKHRNVFRLTQYPNVYYQVSGMRMFCPYPHEILHDMIAEALDQFGPSRLYWGSNYPVVGTQQHYTDDLRLLLDGRLPIPREAIDAIANDTAHQLWFAEFA